MKVSDAVVEVAAKAAYAEVMKDYNPNPGGNWKKEMLSVRERYRANARAALEAALPLVLGEPVGRISGKPMRIHQFNEPVYWLYTLLVEDSRSPAAVGEPVSLPPGTKLYTLTELEQQP